MMAALTPQKPLILLDFFDSKALQMGNVCVPVNHDIAQIKMSIC